MQVKDSTSTVQNASKRRRDRVIFACVIYLLIVVLVMTPVTLSSYVSTATGSDSATVAKLSLDASDNTAYQGIGALQLIPGTDAQIKFLVTSNSEVTMDYTLAVFTEGGLPISNLNLSCETENSIGIGINVNNLEAGAVYTGGVMALGENNHIYTLTISVPSGIDSAYSGELQTFYVRVDATQVD